MKQSKQNLCFIIENKTKDNLIVNAGKIPLGKEKQTKKRLNRLYPSDNFHIKYIPTNDLYKNLSFEQIHELDSYFSRKHTTFDGSGHD